MKSNREQRDIRKIKVEISDILLFFFSLFSFSSHHVCLSLNIIHNNNNSKLKKNLLNCFVLMISFCHHHHHQQTNTWLSQIMKTIYQFETNCQYRDVKMNGVCSSGTATASIDPRGSITSTISPINKRAISGTSGSVNVSGCLPTNQGPDSSMRKSRSQGGKILQKCLSTTSYGEEMSLSVSLRNLKATSPCHSFLISRKYCSFGSTTSHRFICLFLLTLAGLNFLVLSTLV